MYTDTEYVQCRLWDKYVQYMNDEIFKGQNKRD